MVTISRTDLARNTREIVDQVRHGQTVTVQSYGEDQIVLVDALDFRVLNAVVSHALKREVGESDSLFQVVSRYLDEQISLAKAAELLGLSRFDLMERFERLGIPLRLGSASLDEALDEVSAARQAKGGNG